MQNLCLNIGQQKFISIVIKNVVNKPFVKSILVVCYVVEIGDETWREGLQP
jgi:hypothetical protein